jgi:hypothetical protein
MAIQTFSFCCVNTVSITNTANPLLSTFTSWY